MKNRICTLSAAAVVTCTRACPCPPSVSFTTKRKIYDWPAAAPNVVMALLGFARLTCGPPSWIHWKVIGSPSGEYEFDPFNVMLPDDTPIWSGPASATGG